MLVLLFIIAAVIFPPLLLVIPLALIGMVLNWIEGRAKRRKEEVEMRERVENELAALNAEKEQRRAQRKRLREIQNQEVGERLIVMINATVERTGCSAIELADGISKQIRIPFSVGDGKVHITEEQLSELEPYLPKIQKFCDSR